MPPILSPSPGFAFSPLLGLAADLAADNPVLDAGQIGLATDTDVLAMGDGTTGWNSLPKFHPSTTPQILSSETAVANSVISAVADITGLTGLQFTVGATPWIVEGQLPWITGTVAGMLPLLAIRTSADALVKQRVAPALSNPLQGGVAYGSGQIQAIITTPGAYNLKLSMSRLTGSGTLGYGAAASPQLAATLTARPFVP